MINLDIYKIFVKRVGLLGITNILVALNTILLIPILSKNFPASDYGIWIQVNTTFFLITSIASLGLPYTMIRFLSAEKEEKKIQEGFYSMLTLIFIFSALISITILIFTKEIADILFNGAISVVNIISPLILFGALNSFLIDFFITFGHIKKYSLLLIFQTYLFLLLAIYFAISGYSILMVVIGFLITQIILFLIMIFIVFLKIGFKIPKFNYINEYLNFSIPLIPNNLFTWVVESSDRYIIGLFLGTAFIAYYSPGYLLGMSILLFFTPLSIILTSILPQYYENGKINEVMIYINYSLKYFLLIAIPFVFILSLLSKPILMILTTPEIALNGYLITPFVAFSALLFGIYGIIKNLIILEKKTKVIGSIWTIAAIINFLNLIFVPYFGIIAAAAVTLLSYLTAFIISLKYSRKYFESNFDYSFILKSIIASILMSIIILIFNPQGLFSVLIIIGISITAYSSLIFIMKGIDKKEIEFFKSMLKIS